MSRSRYFEDSEYNIEWAESFDDVCRELKTICDYLAEKLPCSSMGPNERVERLARVVPGSQLLSAHHRTARSKLTELRARIDQLVPGDSMTHIEKLQFLVERIDTLVPGDVPMSDKLHEIGDHRSTDAGYFIG
ncbi:hypothetical protein K7711_07075 [Nocardia sp. CA2R105]|uniref:hypothetical protein n=1 Tax=Nocardia coffeae TaxID=2873381 RepID=UPI001CA69312|nr:hypothetical protein [Nocardia coffeae]MBY8856233.1 hypothetical protein [Nocardia coffeae]